MLLVAGIFFLIVALSYAEGTAAIPETGGAATFVRRAFNDLFGFLTGWALFLDYLIVIALSTLFLPHYLGTALGVDALRDSPVGRRRRRRGHRSRSRPSGSSRRSQLHSAGIVVAGLDLRDAAAARDPRASRCSSRRTRSRRGLDLGAGPTWDDLAFALPLAMLAYTGLETVANLAEETREPGRTLPRSLFSAIGLVVVLTVADRGRRARPPSRSRTARRRSASEWLRAPLAGIVEALQRSRPRLVGDALRRLRRPDRCARPARRGDDLDVRLHAARLLARRAPAAAARASGG